MKKKSAWIFLLLGILCLTGYIFLLFHTNYAKSTVAALFLSIVCNVIAVNLFITSRKARRHDDD